MATDKLNIVLDAQWRGKGEVSQANRDIKKLDDGVKSSGVSFATLGKIAGVTAVAIGGIGLAASAAMSELRRGAELELLQTRFEKLTESIGTTSDALLNDMKKASSGMVSQAELIAGANELMQGKLAKSHDAVVRLSTVSTQLGWDMGVLAQTINNQSVLRLDNLGIAAEDVIPKFQALKDAGMDVKEAFTLALIEAGESQLQLVGSEAETTSGKIKIIEASIRDVRDAFSEGFVEGASQSMSNLVGEIDIATASAQRFGEFTGGIVDNLVEGIGGGLIVYDKLNDAMARGLITQGQAVQMWFEVQAGTLSAEDAVSQLNNMLGIFGREGVQATAGVNQEMQGLEGQMYDTAAAAGVLADAVREAMAAGDLAAARQRTEGARGPTFKRLYAAGLVGTDATPKLLNDIASGFGKAGHAAEVASGGVGSFTSELDDAISQMFDLAEATGDFFMQARKYKDGEYNPFESLLESADKYGANALQLADIGVGGGLFSQEEATKYLRRTALMQRADQLGQMVALGAIDTSAAVSQLDQLHKALYEGRVDVVDEFFAGLPNQGEATIEAELALETHPSWLEYTRIRDQIEANPPTVVLNVVNPANEARRERFNRLPPNIPE